MMMMMNFASSVSKISMYVYCHLCVFISIFYTKEVATI